MSFGTSETIFERYTAPCTTDALATPLADALAAGIQPIAAAGNRAYVSGGSFIDGIASPACVPAAISVGGVYDDDDLGPFIGAFCTDWTTAEDQVSCPSQTSPYLSLLAPGWLIAPPGFSAQGGTSFATPHVAGAWAIMRAAAPDLSEALLLQTLNEHGALVTDPRPPGGRTTMRIDLMPEPAQLGQLTAGSAMLWLLRRRRSPIT